MKHKNLLSHIKMGKVILTFRNIEIEKNKFCCRKGPIFLKNLDIEKVLVSKKVSSGTKNHKYFIGQLYNDHNVLPETSAYVKSYNGQTMWMHFLIEDDDIL